MAFLPRRPFKRTRDGRFTVALGESDREVLRTYLEQLRDLLLTDDALLRRLFPTAYVDDPERDREYRALMGGDLLESRFAAIETVEQTLDATELDETAMTQWMLAINALRLVVGTRIDASEVPQALDPDDPDFSLRVLYETLGYLLDHLVEELAGGLPASGTETD